MKKILAVVAVMLGLSATATATASAQEAQAALERFVGGVQTLSAQFTQVQTDEQGKVLASSAGSMLLSRPGKFRWTYTTPYQQLIVCDGAKVWLYDEDLSQVTVRPAGDALRGTPAELLSQRVLLGETFEISDGGSQGKLRIVRLKPKQADSDFKSIELSLDGGTPVRMKFHDQLGGITDVAFNQVRLNPLLDAAQFRFTPPQGVEVVE